MSDSKSAEGGKTGTVEIEIDPIIGKENDYIAHSVVPINIELENREPTKRAL